MVDGATFEDLIQEDVDDGLMEATDSNMVMEREPNAKGDRLTRSMSDKLLGGQFPPHRDYGGDGKTSEHGFESIWSIARCRIRDDALGFI